jgi:hypothetical protein
MGESGREASPENLISRLFKPKLFYKAEKDTLQKAVHMVFSILR